MAFQRILAITEVEIRNQIGPAPPFALFGCHFSPEDGCFVGLADHLPAGCGLVIDDRNPIPAVDLILPVLEQLSPAYVILDFQRPPDAQSIKLTTALAQIHKNLVIPPPYAQGLACPLFLPPVPPHIPMAEHLKPWQGREIWLELALDGALITVTPQGSRTHLLPHAQIPEDSYEDSMLHCHYKISQKEDALEFYCVRTRNDIEEMLRPPLPPNLKYAVALYQELGVSIR